MPKLDIEFAWPVAVAGYEIREIADLRAGGPGAFLVACGTEHRWHNPIAFHPALFRQFAALPETPAACADFASKFGLLFGPTPRVSSIERGPELPPVFAWVQHDVVHSDSIAVWLLQIRRLRRLVEDWDRARSTGESTAPDYRDLMPKPRLIVDLIDRAAPKVLAPPVPRFSADFVEHRPRPSLNFSPNNLLSAIDLQFYQAIAGMTELRACENCGTWFECGPGGTRRSASRFCSDACRFNFHNARKGKGGSP